MTNTSNPFNKQKPYCKYLFDINEPNNNDDDNGWYISWFFRLNNAFEVANFEINWMSLKSKLTSIIT